MAVHRRYVCSAADPGERGFTLVELVLVIVIGIVAMFPLVAMYANATQQSVQPVLITQAVFLAQDRMETVLSDFHAPGRGYSYVTNASYPDVVAPPGFPGFLVHVQVSVDSMYDAVTYKAVTVSASHPAIAPVSLSMWITQ